MLLTNYQIISPKQILCVAKKILPKHYFASQPAPLLSKKKFPPAAVSDSFRSCSKTAIHYFFVNSNPVFFQKIKLCHAYGFLALCQNLEKATDPILSKFPDRRKDEQTYFIGPFRLPPRVQKHKTDVCSKSIRTTPIITCICCWLGER